MRKLFIGLMPLFLFLTACQTTPAEPKVQLTAEEVRATFVDRDWGFEPKTTHFDLGADGTYKYRDAHTKVFGTYEIAEDGVLCAVNDFSSKTPGLRTCFTFYKQGEKYVYFHDRSGKFFTAYLR